MNHSHHPNCHCQRVKMMLARAFFGGAMCFACGAPLAADEKLPQSTANPTSASRITPLSPITSVRLRMPHGIGDSPASSSAIDKPARWADLSMGINRMGYAISPPPDRSGRQQSVQSNAASSVHVGPSPAAFVPETFRGARHDREQLARKQLRPVRLPPTGHFDESVMNARVATAPQRPANVQEK